ncbi:hypothetical protein DICA3_C14246 [Diutina catenulata]
MVTIQYEGVEHLPHLDEMITPEEREEVERLIQMELTRTNQDSLHPQVAQLLPPLSAPASLLGEQMELLEEEEEELDEEFTLGGVDCGVYDVPDYTTLSHALLEQQTTDLYAANLSGLVRGSEQYVERLAQLKTDLVARCGDKRKRADDAADRRKKHASEFNRVNSYLEERWRDGVAGVVEVGVQALQGEASWSGTQL